MAIYNIKLKDRQQVALDTMTFTFEKPSDFTFKAGQWGDFTLENPPKTDAEGNVRGFSIASPPYADNIEVVTRMRNTAFKNVLTTLPIGTNLQLDAPHGSFCLHHDQTIPAVFLSGGIGVTPTRSILFQAAYDKLPQKIFLFYSNHNPETTAFLDEFKTLEIQNLNFKFVPTMTSMDNSTKSWDGETGHIDSKMLSKYVADLLTPIYYISGPSKMVAALRNALTDGGIDDDKIRAEEFSGY